MSAPAPTASPALSPLRKAITVAWPRAAAFRRFTAEMGTWWPLRSHSVGQARAETVVFEEKVGGRIYEVMRGGEQATWGTVTAWEPPQRVAFTWHPGRDAHGAQDIEVRFEPAGAGTLLVLTMTGWERLGALARKARRGYPIGWAYVLRVWADRRWSPLVLMSNVMMSVIRLFRRAAR